MSTKPRSSRAYKGVQGLPLEYFPVDLVDEDTCLRAVRGVASDELPTGLRVFTAESIRKADSLHRKGHRENLALEVMMGRRHHVYQECFSLLDIQGAEFAIGPADSPSHTYEELTPEEQRRVDIETRRLAQAVKNPKRYPRYA